MSGNEITGFMFLKDHSSSVRMDYKGGGSEAGKEK